MAEIAGRVGLPTLSRGARQTWGFLREAPTIPTVILGLLVFVAIFAPLLAPHDPLARVEPTPEECQAAYGFANCPYIDERPPVGMTSKQVIAGQERVRTGSWSTPLGTDYQGRDLLSRLMYGARISLIVSLVGTFVAGAIGTVLGVVAGYFGRWWDVVIMRVTDAWLTLPTLVFAILLSSMKDSNSIWDIVIILAVVFWSRYARLVRGEVLTLRERDFIRLAEVNGVSKVRIVTRHLIPNVMNTVIVFFTLIVGVAIIIEANLSFLGLGIQAPNPAWGLMIFQGQEALFKGNWWLAVFPGICIALLVLSANLFGDWMRVRLDPQLRNR